MKKQWYYFTFLYGSENRNRYVKFYGTFAETREQMFKHFGDKWAFQYDEKEFAGQIEKFGLQEIKNMSFAPETEKLTQELIQAEYKNACEKFGEKFNSLHEGYAVLLEEMEEVKSEFDKLVINTEWIWKKIKDFNNSIYDRNELICLCKKATDHTYDTISELAQVGAVLMKIKNTLQSKEETTEKRKVCSKDCEYINRAYGSYFCNGQKNAPCVNLGDDCYYNDRTEEPKF